MMQEEQKMNCKVLIRMQNRCCLWLFIKDPSTLLFKGAWTNVIFSHYTFKLWNYRWWGVYIFTIYAFLPVKFSSKSTILYYKFPVWLLAYLCVISDSWMNSLWYREHRELLHMGFAPRAMCKMRSHVSDSQLRHKLT